MSSLKRDSTKSNAPEKDDSTSKSEESNSATEEGVDPDASMDVKAHHRQIYETLLQASRGTEQETDLINRRDLILSGDQDYCDGPYWDRILAERQKSFSLFSFLFSTIVFVLSIWFVWYYR
jgi:hypothetical protein